MIDLEVIDALFEGGRKSGTEMQFRLFDKAFLMPLANVPDAVLKETGEATTVDDLRALAAKGWFPLLARSDGDGMGAPLYSFSRVGLFLRMRRELGYGDDELRVFADYEETMIDQVYTQDDLAYLDDDLETVRVYTEARIEALSSAPQDDANTLAKEKRILQWLTRKRDSPTDYDALHKTAFRVRAFNDFTRLMLHQQDRGKIEAGYSPFIVASGLSQRFGEGSGVEISDIHWSATIRSALAHFEGDDTPSIRVPGFVLRGALVVSTRTFLPGDYDRIWKQHDLDSYLHAWGELHGERRCIGCLAPLPAEARPSKRFCAERCRNAAKQRRFRERNPLAADRARKRYWESVELDDGSGGIEQ